MFTATEADSHGSGNSISSYQYEEGDVMTLIRRVNEEDGFFAIRADNDRYLCTNTDSPDNEIDATDFLPSDRCKFLIKEVGERQIQIISVYLNNNKVQNNSGFCEKKNSDIFVRNPVYRNF